MIIGDVYICLQFTPVEAPNKGQYAAGQRVYLPTGWFGMPTRQDVMDVALKACDPSKPKEYNISLTMLGKGSFITCLVLAIDVMCKLLCCCFCLIVWSFNVQLLFYHKGRITSPSPLIPSSVVMSLFQGVASLHLASYLSSGSETALRRARPTSRRTRSPQALPSQTRSACMTTGRASSGGPTAPRGKVSASIYSHILYHMQYNSTPHF